MNAEEFRQAGYQMIDFVADYMDNISDREPLASVNPGYLRSLVPNKAPEKPEPWSSVMNDIEPIIMKGMTHWQVNSKHLMTFIILVGEHVRNSNPSLKQCFTN